MKTVFNLNRLQEISRRGVKMTAATGVCTQYIGSGLANREQERHRQNTTNDGSQGRLLTDWLRRQEWRRPVHL